MKCKLFEICNCKTATCRVKEPDNTCYYYKYFKQIIKNEYLITGIEDGWIKPSRKLLKRYYNLKNK